MADDVAAIVIDNGSGFVKAGFAGDGDCARYQRKIMLCCARF
jgi:hypothetical protein